MTLVQDFLESSAGRRPEQIALVCRGQRLTPAELDAMADRLSHALIEFRDALPKTTSGKVKRSVLH